MSTPAELLRTPQAATPTEETIPSYLIAGGSHSALSDKPGGSDSMFDAMSDIATKFIPLSLASGANQLYNIIPTVGSWLGAETQQSDFNEVVRQYDDDLSKYYQEHKLGTDALGFIASSIVPGMAGVKILNAGQNVLRSAIAEGKFGTNVGNALGMLAPSREKNISSAIKSIRESGNVFALTEANTLKALASGVGQNALEGAAFTTLVNATMYTSPVLDGRDIGDLSFDVLLGAGLGGAFGGLFSGVGAASRIKKAGKMAEKELAPWGVTGVPASNMPASDRILFRAQMLDEMPALPTTGDLVARATRVSEATKNKTMLEIREDFKNLTGDDGPLAQALFDHMKVSGLKTNRDNLLDALSSSRVDKTSSTETSLNAVNKKLKDNLYDFTKLSEEEFELYRGTKVAFVKLRGEGMGNVADERPAILSLADKLSKGQTISLHPQGLQVGTKLYKNENNIYRPFNIMGASHFQVEARYAWAEMLPKWVDDAVDKAGKKLEIPAVHMDDIPLLQKAYKDGITKLNVIPGGAIADMTLLSTREAIEDLLKRQKVNIAGRLAKAETMPMDEVTFTDKMKSLFGINFNLVDDPTVNGFFSRISSKLGGISIAGDAIAFSKQSALKRTLAQNVATLKHEEGHAIFQSLLDSHGINKENMRYAIPKLYAEVVRVSKSQRPHIWKSKDPKMVEYRESLHELFADAFSHFSKNPNSLGNYPEFNSFAGHLVRPIPQSVIDAVSRRASKPTATEIAKIVDMEEAALGGTVREGGFFARDKARADYADMLKRTNTRASEQVSDVHFLPSYAKVVSSSKRVKDINGTMVDATTDLKARAKLYDDSATRVATNILGEELPNISDEALLGGGSAGPTLLGFENANYGSRGSWASYIGQRAHSIIQKEKTGTSDTFTPTLAKLSQDTNSAIEFSVLNEKLRNLPQAYRYEDVLDNAGRVVGGKMKYEGSTGGINVPMEIPIESQLVRDLVQMHIQKNGERLGKLGEIRANEGLPNLREPTHFYPIPRDPKDTPFFAFVIDDSVTGTGHSKMLYAKSAEDLEKLKNRVTQELPDLRVLTKGESEDYFKAHGRYEYERSINENYINNGLSRKGISSSFLPTTDPKKIVTDFMDWHLQRDSSLVREAISHRYSRQFETLRAAAEPTLQASKSKFGYISPLAYAENSVNNPASNVIKMALDIQKVEEYPFWSTMNKQLDGKISQVAQNVSKLWDKAVHPEQLDEINNALVKAGYGGPMVDSALYEAMNGSVPRGLLTSFVAKANGLLGTLALRMDPLNALNNAVGHAVLGGTEAKAVLSAIRKGDAEAVGDLAKLGNMRLPGTSDDIFSPTKIMGNSFSRLQDPKVKQWHKDKGFITSIMDQYDQTLDTIAIRAGDTGASLGSRVSNAMNVAKGIGNTGERLTGNKMAEEFNRFIAADFMKQVTDVAVKHGIMDDKTALTYINTFVNRTQGNFLASQRPILFQGPVGQAIGLFQTYQFNMIQQLLRHVGDGQAKNAATMMGLQASVYGMNGLPAFNALNTYIVGNAGGNTNHTDLYQAIFNGAGKEAGEWLTYGALSNAFSIFHPDLKMNMYSRGDVNPRSLTIVPTDPAKIPIVQATGRFFANIKDGISQVGMGASVWDTTLRAVEHNGVSRPLAGLAQVLGGATNASGQVIATNNQGNLLMAHDLMNLASGVRMLGGKPLDESMVQDQMFRINTYRAHDSAKRKSLSEAIKTTILSDGIPSDESMEKFSKTYTEQGGKQTEFAQFMARQYTNANTSQAEQLRNKLASPYSTQLQRIMGGYGSEDL